MSGSYPEYGDRQICLKLFLLTGCLFMTKVCQILRHLSNILRVSLLLRHEKCGTLSIDKQNANKSMVLRSSKTSRVVFGHSNSCCSKVFYVGISLCSFGAIIALRPIQLKRQPLLFTSLGAHTCCVFQPANRCFAPCLLVKINFFCIYQCFSIKKRKIKRGGYQH